MPGRRSAGPAGTMERQYRTIGSRTISYFDTVTAPEAPPTPSGRVLVLLHAFPLNAAMWEPQLVSPPPGWRVIAPDLGGFGPVGVPAGQPEAAPAIDDYADDVLALLDRLAIPHAVIGGLSMGGYVTFAILRAAAHRCRGVLLADTRAEADSEEARALRIEALALVRREGVRRLVDDMLPRLLGSTSLRERPTLAERVRALAAESRQEAVAGAIARLMTRPDATPELSAIACPALVIVGSEDTLTPPDLSRRLRLLIPDAGLVVIPGAGHLSSLEQPEQFTAAVTAWLNALPEDQ